MKQARQPKKAGLQPPSFVVLEVRLGSGKLKTRVRVCVKTWAVLGIDQPMCGDVETWHFAKWQTWGAER